MTRPGSFTAFILLFCNLQAQPVITFHLNMQPLIDNNLFAPANGERVFLRGSFNQWQGFENELKKKDDTGIFVGTFDINANIGDTLEYKFIIKDSDDRIYWEKNPDPENLNYGNRKLKIIESSDAFIEAFKSKTVENHFSEKYALAFGYPERFMIRYFTPGDSIIKEAEIIPVSIGTIHKKPVRGNNLSLTILNEGHAAILTINTFIYYDQLEMFQSFIDSTFQMIQNKKMDNLIIDLRGNDGGDPFCSSYLLSYIEKKPVQYFAEQYSRYASLAEPIPFAKENRFQGNLYTLIDGGCFSTTGHFCALLKYHKIGRLVGLETGATFTCTGSVCYINLENSRLILGTARNQRYSAAV